PPRSTLFPYTTLFRSHLGQKLGTVRPSVGVGKRGIIGGADGPYVSAGVDGNGLCSLEIGGPGHAAAVGLELGEKSAGSIDGFVGGLKGAGSRREVRIEGLSSQV